MVRNKKIAIVAHCTLNQNVVLCGWERAVGPFSTYIANYLSNGISMMQLPCPEVSFAPASNVSGQVDRAPLNYSDYNTPEYREHCVKILEPFFQQLKPLLKDGCQMVELLGIEESPSCDLRKGHGVFMEVFFEQLEMSTPIETLRMVPETYEEK